MLPDGISPELERQDVGVESGIHGASVGVSSPQDEVRILTARLSCGSVRNGYAHIAQVGVAGAHALNSVGDCRSNE